MTPPARFVLNRDVRAEAPWVPQDLLPGSVVYEFRGATYGCITPSGLACSRIPGETPFFEVPWDALDETVAPVCGQCGNPSTFGTPGGDSKTELRPYGPGGTMICYRCATATPEREAEAMANFGALLEAASAAGGGVVTLDRSEDGPIPGPPL